MRTPKVLVVDDFGPWRSLVRSQLTYSDFQVVAEASNGRDAIEMAEQLHPDVVLLDIEMPLLNGLEAAPRIRHVSPSTKIIFLTQQVDDDIKSAALATGAVGYLLKSDAGELASAIHAALGSTEPFQAALSPSFVFGIELVQK
jgi:DNA-binding NarL/FixJ family response regulator